MTSLEWPRSSRGIKWLLLAMMLPFGAIVASRWSVPPSAAEGDYAQYLLHAKAIVEGRPYTDIGYIHTDMNWVGPQAQPPGWPLVLAPFVAVFGTDSQVFKGLVTVLVAVFAMLAGWYFVRRGEPVVGIATALVVPVAIETEFGTSSALSDPLFCVLVWLTFLVADGDKLHGWRRGLMLAALCVAAISVRVAGVALPPALLLQALLTRRDHGMKVIVPLALLVVAGGVFVFFGGDHIPFIGKTFRIMSSPSELARTYGPAIATAALYPFASNGLDDAYHAVAAIPLVVGAVVLVRQNVRSVIPLFVLTYAALLALSPVREARYAWPLFPLVMACITMGFLWLGNRYLVRVHRLVPRLVIGFVAAVTIGATVQVMQKPARDSLLGDADTRELFDWVSVNGATTPMRVVFTNPRVMTLETHVPAMGIPAGEPDKILDELERKNITHVVIPRRFTRSGERRLAAIVSQRAAQFPSVFRNAGHEVHRFIAHPAPAADSGIAFLPARR